MDIKLKKIFINENKNFIKNLKKQINYRASPVSTFAILQPSRNI